MGDDGHTASLFPSHALLDEVFAAVAPIEDSPKPPSARVTLTLPLLNRARLALFIVAGASKAAAVKEAFGPEPEAPAGLVVAAQRTHWLLDVAAAAELLADEHKAAHMYS
uniref:Glucosamine/galactosamine-6-phosphate isomerase domain-containing protein n=2 Tax=Chrysotila carterae TaxID=13221 RepID=A0A7S4B9I7_CHRCT